MRTPTATMLYDAANLINGVDHVLANTRFATQLSANDCYSLAEKLDRACHLLLVVGDRKYQDELNEIDLPTEGAPF